MQNYATLRLPSTILGAGAWLPPFDRARGQHRPDFVYESKQIVLEQHRARRIPGRIVLRPS